MAFELIYTSSQQGLKAGTRGFCTVACTAGMSAPLASTLESLCGYRHLFPPGSDKASLNPVVYSHLYFQNGGVPINVLSRIADAGLDYSGRTNKICHHIVPDSNELISCGPAALLLVPNMFVTSWNEPSRFISSRKQLPTLTRDADTCRQWQIMTGDPGWGGVLAAAVELNRPVALSFQPGQDILPLFDEAIALLPHPLRWKATFSSFYTRMPPGISCLWKTVLAGSTEEGQVRAIPGSILIDLTRSGDNADQYAALPVFDRYVKWARNGVPNTAASLKEVPKIAVPEPVSVPVAVPTADENPDLFYNDTAIDLEHLSSVSPSDSSLPQIQLDYGRNRSRSDRAYSRTKNNWIIATILILFVVLATIGMGVGIWLCWPKNEEAESVKTPQQVAAQPNGVTMPVVPSKSSKSTKNEKQGSGDATVKAVPEPKKSSEIPVVPVVDPEKEKKTEKAEAASQKESSKASVSPVPSSPQQEKNPQPEKSPASQPVVPPQPNYDHFKGQAQELLQQLNLFQLPLQTDNHKLKFTIPATPSNDSIALCKSIVDFCRENKVQLELSVIPFIEYKGCEVPKPCLSSVAENGFKFQPEWIWKNRNRFAMKALTFSLSPENGVSVEFNNIFSGYQYYLFNPILFSKLRWRFLDENQEELAADTHQLLAPISFPYLNLPLTEQIDLIQHENTDNKKVSHYMWDQFEENILLRRGTENDYQIISPELLAEKKSLDSESSNLFNANALFQWECQLVHPPDGFVMDKIDSIYSVKYEFKSNKKEVLQTGLFLNWKKEDQQLNHSQWKTFFYFYSEKQKVPEIRKSLPIWLTISSQGNIGESIKLKHINDIVNNIRAELNTKYKIATLQNKALEDAKNELENEFVQKMKHINDEWKTLTEGWKDQKLVISYKISMKKNPTDNETICIVKSAGESQ